MPKWVYDPKTCSMIPQERTNDIDFQLLKMGFQVSDYKQNLTFVIGPDDSITFRDRGIHQRLYTDYNRAARVAQRIHRVYPKSRFGTPEGLLSWRRGANPELDHPNYRKNESISGEDKALLRSISEVYESKEIENFVNNISESSGYEGHFSSVIAPQSSAEKTPGMTEKGLKGLLRAIPGCIAAFLVCPPAAIIGLIGAVHSRAENRWVKSRINPNRWLDFISISNAKKEEIKKKIEEEMAKNVDYYIAELANGEILRVVGSTTIEAKEMVEAIEKKVYFPRGEKMNAELKNNANKAWKVIFDDNEVRYIVGPESHKTALVAVAQEEQKQLVDAYRGIYKEVSGSSFKGTGKETDIVRYPIKVAKADDISILETGFTAIDESNYKKYKIYKGMTGHDWKASYNKYVLKIGNLDNNPLFTINIPAVSKEDLIKILNNLKQSDTFNTILAEKIDDEIIQGNINRKIDLRYYTVTMTNRDVFIVPGVALDENDDQISYAGTGEVTSRAKQNVMQRLAELTNSIEENIYSAIMDDENISKETKSFYKRFSGSNRGPAMYYRFKETDTTDEPGKDNIQYKSLLASLDNISVEEIDINNEDDVKQLDINLKTNQYRYRRTA